MENKPEMIIVNYQLTDQDYKNIMTRTFYKLWWVGLIIIGFLLGSGYLLVINTADSTVQKILSKEIIKSQFYDYKEKLLSQASIDINQAKKFFINEIKKYEKLPYNLSDNSLKLFDTTGKVLILEYGTGLTNTPIYFKEHFNSIPNIHVSLSDPSYLNNKLFQYPINIKFASKNQFLVTLSTNRVIGITSRIKINWFAIGN
ncbi:MAG: H-type lectin domain-containing protein [bacterium]